MGIDVILVHRPLKDPVTVPEYVLVSEDLYDTASAPLPDPAHEVSQELEGFGPVRAYFLDVPDLPVPARPLPDASMLERVGRTLVIAGAGMPHMFGFRRRRRRTTASAF